jgi:hypothetical protein
MCCPDGKCLCRGEPPSALSGEPGPYAASQYALAGVGCVFHPKDAAPPFAAIAVSDGFGGSGGCASVQTGAWGPFYASHGIVAVIVDTGSGDQASARGEALTKAIAALKAENDKSDSPLFGKLAGRYGTSGFSMGGVGSTFASKPDAGLLSSIAIMPWGKAAEGSAVPTLILCGAKDGIAPCASYGVPAYASLGASVSKMRVTLAGPHDARPSADDNRAGAYALAFQKVFLEGDPRWRPLLVAAEADESTIR